MKISGLNLAIAFCLCLVFQLRGQVTFNFVQPDLFSFKIKDIDNITILNSGSVISKVTVVYSIRSLNRGEVVSVTFKNVVLPKGNTKFYYNQGIVAWGQGPLSIRLKNGGGLSKEGSELCVNVFDENESRDILEQCIDLLFIPPTPIELEYPENISVIDNVRPNFEWIPSTPLISELNYNLILVEKKEKQTCMEAMEQNPFLIRKNAIITNRINFPSEYGMLEYDKTYCWRVSGLLDNIESSMSETWEFTIKKDSLEKKLFIPLLNEIQSSAVYKIYNNELRFAIENKRVEKDLKWTIEDGQSKKVVLSGENQTIILLRGINQYLIDCGQLKSGKTYVLNVFEVNDKSYSITFSK